MTDLIKIAVDAMGGDNSPNKIIDGVILNHKSNKNIFYKIFGDENKIKHLISDKVIKIFLKSFILQMLLKALIVLLRVLKEEKILVCGLLYKVLKTKKLILLFQQEYRSIISYFKTKSKDDRKY